MFVETFKFKSVPFNRKCYNDTAFELLHPNVVDYTIDVKVKFLDLRKGLDVFPLLPDVDDFIKGSAELTSKEKQ